MKKILLKLANGNNSFEWEVLGAKRVCRIIELDLWGLDEDKGKVKVTFEEPIIIKATRRVEFNNPFSYSMEPDSSIQEVEVAINEHWIYIGY